VLGCLVTLFEVAAYREQRPERARSVFARHSNLETDVV
jgi:hypothetical protein